METRQSCEECPKCEIAFQGFQLSQFTGVRPGTLTAQVGETTRDTLGNGMLKSQPTWRSRSYVVASSVRRGNGEILFPLATLANV